jgi:hypothetical protein
MRLLRISLIAVLAAGIAFAIVAGPAHAADLVAQTGYGAPQELGEQVIEAKSASSSNVAFWAGILVAAAILGTTGFIGWRRAHDHTDY